jgi:hypothetical protein
VRWAKIRPYPRLVGSHTYVQIPLDVSFGLKDLLLADSLAFLHRIASIDIWCVCHLSGSKFVLMEADSRDSMVPVSHRHTQAISILVNCAIY